MTAMVNGTGQNITTSTVVNKTPGMTLVGIFVSAASSTPTITVYDVATATTNGKVIDTFTPTAGTFYPMYVNCQNGFYVVLSGTVSCTPVVG